MHLTSLDRVGAEVDGRTLFSDVSFGLTSDDRVAVVGPNGAGKTTLLRILAGERAPDAGAVVPRTGLRTAVLAQAPHLPAASALEVALATAGDATARAHEAAALLDRLGIDPEHRTDAMSGGQQRRVALAATLLTPADLLVLDEPTNHLDVATIEWLEQELARRAGGLVLVTHDRAVLERLTNRMLDLVPPAPGEPAEVVWHDGNYSSLLAARAERAAARQRATARARNLLRAEIAWLQRGPKARTSKPRFRREQVELLRAAAAGDPEAQPLDLGTGRRRLGDRVLTLEGVTLRRGSTTVLDQVDLEIGPGERVGLVGANGAGKTSLLHVLTGQLTPDAGEVRRGTTVELGSYEQNADAGLDPDVTVLASVLAIAAHVPLADGTTLPAHRLAERFGFDGTAQRTPIGLLSGGERRRVALLHLLVAAPNVLVLDEPTNDLDLETLRVLEDHLDGFAGTLLVASHDRFLLERLTERTLAVGAGQVTEHLDVAAAQAAGRLGRLASAAATDRAPGQARAADNRARQAARRRARALEDRIGRLTEQQHELHARMVDAATDPDRLLELQTALTALETELSEVEDAWLELAVD